MAEDSSDRSLSRRLFLIIALPVALLIFVGAVLGLQIMRLSENARWVDHTDTVIAKLYEVQKRIIDQETGIRGYLVTGKAVYLQPYENANVPLALEELRAQLSDNPEQLRRHAEFQSRYEAWFRESERVAHGEIPVETARSDEYMAVRKGHMDGIRQKLGELLDSEYRQRQLRQDALSASNQTTAVIFVVLLGATAFVISLYSSRSVRQIAKTFNDALEGERETRLQLEREEWVRSGQMRLTESVQGTLEVPDIGKEALKALAEHAGAAVGALFAADAQGFRRRSIYGLDAESAGPELFANGEGQIGRAVAAGGVSELQEIPRGYLRIRSGLGETEPRHILFATAAVDNVKHAVLELGFLSEPKPRVRELLSRIGEPLAVAIRSAEYRARLKDLLEESQRQSEELQTQGEELRVTNEELQEQSKALQEAQRRLEERQEELEQSNASLENQTSELQRAQRELTEKAKEVERTSRYKSEFLANMSHELRTPLNSSLILAKLLSENKQGNLDPEQVRYAETIYAAGNDLLTLINDILDLSKIEAGKVDVHAEATSLRRILDPLWRTFEPIAKEKKLQLLFQTAEGVTDSIHTDVQRVQQILKNLLSNALKFTEKGEVVLRVEGDDQAVRFSVRDSGIGIPQSAHQLIFEAFRQADGTSNRKYGGTGLGLTISRDLAHLLGGTLTLQSEVGKGSTFTLALPRTQKTTAPISEPQAPPPRWSPRTTMPMASGAASSRAPSPNATDVEAIDASRRMLLIVEDDAHFADILVDLAKELDFQGVIAPTADDALRLVARHVPAAVILDINLPDHSGLSVLDRLKRDPRTRHVPVHVVSGTDFSQQAMAMGAAGYMLKPADRDALTAALRSLEQRFVHRVRRVLVVEDDPVQRSSLMALLGGNGVELTAVGTVGEALQQLRTSTFDCVVTDLMLPDATGDDLLQKMAEDESYAFPPVIVYTGRSLSEEEEQRLRRHSSSIIVKGARSPERLVDEVTLFLHQVEADLPADRQRLLKQARDREKIFEGRRILIAEDDVRNIFALSSILEPKGAKLIVARNGREALELLDKETKIDLVLMDIMMPEMDGLTAMREIRKRQQFAKLPVIALTAKAMRDDQERCLQAGANDYVAKPIDVEMLLSLLRVWMPK